MNRLLVPVVLVALAGPAAGEARTITLTEAIELAAGDSLAIDLQEEQVAAARAKKKSTSALRFPSLSTKASVLMWSDEITFAQPCNPAEVPGCPMSGVIELTVRDRVTGSAELNLAQPLSGLIVLGRLIDGDQAAIDAASAELQVARLDAGYQAAEAYLGAMQTETLHQLAITSVKQLEANLEKIRALREADVLADVDVLRVEAARDQAKAGALEAEVGSVTARRGLALLLDLPDGTDLALAPVDTTPPALGWSEDEAVSLARAAVKADYFPNILAIANYTRTEGQGFIATKNSAFVGVSLEWNLWDWGKRGHDVAAARAASRSAARLRDELDDQLAFDVRAKWLTASSKRQSLTVHESALRAAEEAYRLQTVKIQGGLATATDVIDAEAEVARARAQEAVARYQYLIAWMALVRAVGQMPQMPGAK
ncbi:MAG: TolC family protein [Deltaproteobacteria bacterium]|nr:TolC family protein [Kofleriaceae bacterium]